MSAIELRCVQQEITLKDFFSRHPTQRKELVSQLFQVGRWEDVAIQLNPFLDKEKLSLSFIRELKGKPNTLAMAEALVERLEKSREVKAYRVAQVAERVGIKKFSDAMFKALCAEGGEPAVARAATSTGPIVELDGYLIDLLNTRLPSLVKIKGALSTVSVSWKSVVGKLKEEPSLKEHTRALDRFQARCEREHVTNGVDQSEDFLTRIMHLLTVRQFVNALAECGYDLLCKEVCTEAKALPYFRMLMKETAEFDHSHSTSPIDSHVQPFLNCRLPLVFQMEKAFSGILVPNVTWKNVVACMMVHPAFQNRMHVLHNIMSEVESDGTTMSAQAGAFYQRMTQLTRATMRVVVKVLADCGFESLCKELCMEAKAMSYFATLTFGKDKEGFLPSASVLSVKSCDLETKCEIERLESAKKRALNDIAELRKELAALQVKQEHSLPVPDVAAVELCLSCKKLPVTHMLIPCGHALLCQACALNVLQSKKCPVSACNKAVSETIRFYS